MHFPFRRCRELVTKSRRVTLHDCMLAISSRLLPRVAAAVRQPPFQRNSCTFCGSFLLANESDSSYKGKGKEVSSVLRIDCASSLTLRCPRFCAGNYREIKSCRVQRIL